MFLFAYFFFAEAWFSILFTVIVEVCDASVRSTAVGLFMFVLGNVGGNLPIVVDPLSKIIGYREAIYIVWPGEKIKKSLQYTEETLLSFLQDFWRWAP